MFADVKLICVSSTRDSFKVQPCGNATVERCTLTDLTDVLEDAGVMLAVHDVSCRAIHVVAPAPKDSNGALSDEENTPNTTLWESHDLHTNY